jgi:hypothetical protein
MGRCTIRPVNSVAIRKQVVTTARIIEPGLSQTNNVVQLKLFRPEASNALIVDAEGADGMGMRRSQASHITDIGISHGQTAGCGSASATSSSPVGLIVIIIQFNSILYYLCAESTATRPITDTAQ